jgi:Tfp pilus assembly ATPase PilU
VALEFDNFLKDDLILKHKQTQLPAMKCLKLPNIISNVVLTKEDGTTL